MGLIFCCRNRILRAEISRGAKLARGRSGWSCIATRLLLPTSGGHKKQSFSTNSIGHVPPLELERVKRQMKSLRYRFCDGNFLPRTTRRRHASRSTPLRTHLRHGRAERASCSLRTARGRDRERPAFHRGAERKNLQRDAPAKPDHGSGRSRSQRIDHSFQSRGRANDRSYGVRAPRAQD